MKKIIVLILCVFLMQATCFAGVTLEATGYDWIGYNWGEKITLVSLIFNELGGGKSQKVEYGVDALNGYYARVAARFEETDPERERMLSVTCVDVMDRLFEEAGDESMKLKKKKRVIPIPFLSSFVN